MQSQWSTNTPWTDAEEGHAVQQKTHGSWDVCVQANPMRMTIQQNRDGADLGFDLQGVVSAPLEVPVQEVVERILLFPKGIEAFRALIRAMVREAKRKGEPADVSRMDLNVPQTFAEREEKEVYPCLIYDQFYKERTVVGYWDSLSFADGRWGAEDGSRPSMRDPETIMKLQLDETGGQGAGRDGSRTQATVAGARRGDVGGREQNWPDGTSYFFCPRCKEPIIAGYLMCPYDGCRAVFLFKVGMVVLAPCLGLKINEAVPGDWIRGEVQLQKAWTNTELVRVLNYGNNVKKHSMYSMVRNMVRLNMRYMVRILTFLPCGWKNLGYTYQFYRKVEAYLKGAIDRMKKGEDLKNFDDLDRLFGELGYSPYSRNCRRITWNWRECMQFSDGTWPDYGFFQHTQLEVDCYELLKDRMRSYLDRYFGPKWESRGSQDDGVFGWRRFYDMEKDIADVLMNQTFHLRSGSYNERGVWTAFSYFRTSFIYEPEQREWYDRLCIAYGNSANSKKRQASLPTASYRAFRAVVKMAGMLQDSLCPLCQRPWHPVDQCPYYNKATPATKKMIADLNTGEAVGRLKVSPILTSQHVADQMGRAHRGAVPIIVERRGPPGMEQNLNAVHGGEDVMHINVEGRVHLKQAVTLQEAPVMQQPVPPWRPHLTQATTPAEKKQPRPKAAPTMPRPKWAPEANSTQRTYEADRMEHRHSDIRRPLVLREVDATGGEGVVEIHTSRDFAEDVQQELQAQGLDVQMVEAKDYQRSDRHEPGRGKGGKRGASSRAWGEDEPRGGRKEHRVSRDHQQEGNRTSHERQDAKWQRTSATTSTGRPSSSWQSESGHRPEGRDQGTWDVAPREPPSGSVERHDDAQLV